MPDFEPTADIAYRALTFKIKCVCCDYQNEYEISIYFVEFSVIPSMSYAKQDAQLARRMSSWDVVI